MSHASSRRRRLWRDGSGNAAPEFALIALIFLTLVLGGIEFGRYFFTVEALRTVTAEAARTTLVRYNSSGSCPTSTAVKAAANTKTPFLIAANLTVTVLCAKDTADRVTINVTTRYPFTSSVPFTNFLDSTLVETASLVY